tara:strand:+ start:328 stop:495 length:168 start_codon:yes stop_codon:yes gene_type:complete
MFVGSHTTKLVTLLNGVIHATRPLIAEFLVDDFPGFRLDVNDLKPRYLKSLEIEQ